MRSKITVICGAKYNLKGENGKKCDVLGDFKGSLKDYFDSEIYIEVLEKCDICGGQPSLLNRQSRKVKNNY